MTRRIKSDDSSILMPHSHKFHPIILIFIYSPSPLAHISSSFDSSSRLLHLYVQPSFCFVNNYSKCSTSINPQTLFRSNPISPFSSSFASFNCSIPRLQQFMNGRTFVSCRLLLSLQTFFLFAWRHQSRRAYQPPNGFFSKFFPVFTFTSTLKSIRQICLAQRIFISLSSCLLCCSYLIAVLVPFFVFVQFERGDFAPQSFRPILSDHTVNNQTTSHHSSTYTHSIAGLTSYRFISLV